MCKEKNKKNKIEKCLMILFCLAMGALSGIYIGRHFGRVIYSGDGLRFGFLGLSLLFFVFLFVSYFIHIFIHESGHLVFGLLSGYRFCSFRIFGFMWIKENGKIKFRRLSLAGTAGQCLMLPPDREDTENIPTVFLNLGGVLMNLIFSVIFFGMSFVFKNVPILSMLFDMLFMIGVYAALVNGIPFGFGIVHNDGQNTLDICKSGEARRSFIIQLLISERLANGERLRDMPSEWFKVPDDVGMNNRMTSVMGVFAANRFMDEKDFESGARLMEHMLEGENGILGIHRNLMICDMIYYKLICGKDREVCEMLTPDIKKFMGAMRKFLSVIRVEYTIALLYEKDESKAGKLAEDFERLFEVYPYRGDAQSERELMLYAKELYDRGGF